MVTKNKKLIYSILIILIFVSILLKGIFFINYNQLPLSGDAPSFVANAQKMSSFYDASKREPLWILWVKVFSKLSNDPKTGIRTANYIINIISVFLFFLVAAKFTDTLPSLIGSLFFINIPYLFYSPLRAHRFELFICLLLLLTQFIFFIKKSVITDIAISVISAALILVRAESFSILVFLIPFYFFRMQKNNFLRRFVLFFIPLIILVLPFFYNCYKTYGSYFYVLDRHARFYKTAQDINENNIKISEMKNAHENKSTSFTEYLIKENGALKLVFKSFSGYLFILTKGILHLLSTPFDMRFLIILIYPGILLLFLVKNGWKAVYVSLSYLFPFSFIITTPVPGYNSVDIRLYAPISILMSFSIACLFFHILNRQVIYQNVKKILFRIRPIKT